MEIRNSKLHQDLVAEISQGNPQESIRWLMITVADRIEGCRGNPVKLSDLVSILRENSTSLTNAVLGKR
jgi:hypothetical protein